MTLHKKDILWRAYGTCMYVHQESDEGKKGRAHENRDSKKATEEENTKREHGKKNAAVILYPADDAGKSCYFIECYASESSLSLFAFITFFCVLSIWLVFVGRTKSVDIFFFCACRTETGVHGAFLVCQILSMREEISRGNTVTSGIPGACSNESACREREREPTASPTI